MLMKGKDAKKTLSLVVALFLLQIINTKKVSASASWLSPPDDDEDEQRCGFESCYEKCPPGSCCSWLGYCGTGKRHCGREYCKTQCPFPSSGRPLPLYVPGRCGVQAGGTKCPTGLCCSEDGWCGATEYHCNPQRCQSQCRNLTSSSTENLYGDFDVICMEGLNLWRNNYAEINDKLFKGFKEGNIEGKINEVLAGEPECGQQGCYKKCPPGSCCSIWGYCGTTKEYCDVYRCQSQCPPPHPPPEASIRCGNEARGRKCPTGLCCSLSGWCGTSEYYCGKYQCKSQCPSPPPPPYAPGRCGMQAGGRKCPPGLCCSGSGWCGTTELYCAKQWCQSQCKASHKSTSETFLLYGVV